MGNVDRGDANIIVVNHKYDRSEGFFEGLAPVLIGDKWGFIDKTGEYVWEPSK